MLKTVWNRCARFASSVVIALGIVSGLGPAGADEGHDHASEQEEMIEEMREMHEGHDHGHDFEAMDEVSREDMRRVLGMMVDIGLALPPMNSERGRTVFMEKGCVACHSVNDVGGSIGPSLNAKDMPDPMNAFEFAARMWRGAPAMVEMQEDLLGDAISLSGQELADIIAFVHDEREQKQITASQIPERYRQFVGE